MMKKTKILFAAAIVASCCISWVSGFRSTEGSSVILENVEALTAGEFSFDFDKCCVEDDQYDCIPNYMGLIQGRSVPC